MSQPPLFTRQFCLLVLGHFLQALGFSSLILFPLYLDHLGASRADIGVITAIAPLSGLLARPAVAWALDSVGRKPTLITGTCALVLGMAGIGAVDDLGPLVYLDRVVIGLGLAALFTGYFTWATDLIPAGRRTEGIALFGASGLVPLACNAFVDRIGVAPPDLRWFLPAVGGVIALSLVVLLALPEPAREDAGAVRTPYSVRDVVRALRHSALIPTWLATCLLGALVGLFMTFATVTASSRLAGDGFWEQPACLWLMYAAAALTIRLFGGRMPDRLGAYNLIAPALASYTLACVILSGASDPGSFLIAGTLAGVGHGLGFPILVTQVVARSPVRWRGSALAAYTALWGVTEFSLVPVFGEIADAHGDAALYAIAGAGVVALLAVWATLEHRWGANVRQPDAPAAASP